MMHYYIYFVNFILKDNNIEHLSYKNSITVKDVTSVSKKIPNQLPTRTINTKQT